MALLRTGCAFESENVLQENALQNARGGRKWKSRETAIDGERR
jgi:hypothetical protein